MFERNTDFTDFNDFNDFTAFDDFTAFADFVGFTAFKGKHKRHNDCNRERVFIVAVTEFLA